MDSNKKQRKLNLNRETLAPLQPSELDEVNGGGSISISFSRSSFSWTPVSISLVKADPQGQSGQGGNGPQYA